MIKIHPGCFINLQEVIAMWSEIYVDPKLDSSSYLVRVLFTNNPTILTVGTYRTKEEADNEIRRILKR